MPGQQRRERKLRSFLGARFWHTAPCACIVTPAGKDRIAAFSYKGRAVCSSCSGRRMVHTAAHVVDRVLAKVPVRQWVLSLPFPCVTAWLTTRRW
ncbi:MAG: hypothetical protein DMG09_01050 [Acidobacteria bacterium]|nr:MAG: hypothetical protein DMG09_01050 [Acidobacteriota bacterium]